MMGVDITALDDLMCKMKDPKFRRKFQLDSEGAMAEEGLDAAAIPEAVRTALAELSTQELRLISHLNSTLFEAGFKADGAICVSIV